MNLLWHNVSGERVTNKRLGTRLVCHFQGVLLQPESHPLQAFGAGHDSLSEGCHQGLVVIKHFDNVLAQDVIAEHHGYENVRNYPSEKIW